MTYVYLLESAAIRQQRYIGATGDLKRRLREHNEGKSVHTRKYRPWRLVAYFAFADEVMALRFERYLKSGSGHAFAKRHFLRCL